MLPEINEENRWKNAVLNEMKKTNALLENLLERNAQAVEPKSNVQPIIKKPMGRPRTKGAVNQ